MQSLRTVAHKDAAAQNRRNIRHSSRTRQSKRRTEMERTNRGQKRRGYKSYFGKKKLFSRHSFCHRHFAALSAFFLRRYTYYCTYFSFLTILFRKFTWPNVLFMCLLCVRDVADVALEKLSSALQLKFIFVASPDRLPHYTCNNYGAFSYCARKNEAAIMQRAVSEYLTQWRYQTWR